MSDSDALEEIMDLFEAPSTAKTTRLRVAGQRMAKDRLVRGQIALAENAARAAFFSRTKRPEPSLPRLKFLERDD